MKYKNVTRYELFSIILGIFFIIGSIFVIIGLVKVIGQINDESCYETLSTSEPDCTLAGNIAVTTLAFIMIVLIFTDIVILTFTLTYLNNG